MKSTLDDVEGEHSFKIFNKFKLVNSALRELEVSRFPTPASAPFICLNLRQSLLRVINFEWIMLFEIVCRKQSKNSVCKVEYDSELCPICF